MWGLIGHQGAVTELDRSLRAGRLAHAYLVAGPPRVGKMALAICVAQAVNCLSPDQPPCMTCNQCRRISLGQHPDVTVVGLDRNPEGRTRKEIGIDEVRGMQHASTLKPYEGRCRVFIVDGAELLSEEACNCILKLLEEPPPQTMLLLLTASADSLMPTISSRCRAVQLRPVPMEQVTAMIVEQKSLPREEAERLARLSLGCPGWALSAVEDPTVLEERDSEVDRIGQVVRGELGKRFEYAAELAAAFFRDRDEVRDRLNLWLRWWRDLLLSKEGASELALDQKALEAQGELATRLTAQQIVSFIQAIGEALDALDANANPRLALEVLMLRLPTFASSPTS